MTYYELRKNILLKIDEYEPSLDTQGQSFAMTDDEDILAKLPYVINESIRFAFNGKSYKQTWNIYQGGTFNLLTETESEHRIDDVIFEAEGVYGYYFEIDDTADVRVEIYQKTSGEDEEETWEWVLDHKVPDTTDDNRYTDIRWFKKVCGDGQRVRLVFGGDTYYNISNVALYNVRFSSDEKVPVYNKYNAYTIPKGLYKVNTVYYLGETEKKPIKFTVKGDKLYLPEEYVGKFEIESTFFPELVTAVTDSNLEKPEDSFELDLPKDIEYAVVEKACAFLSQDGEFDEFVNDSEQWMQMLEPDRGHSAPVLKRFW